MSPAHPASYAQPYKRHGFRRRGRHGTLQGCASSRRANSICVAGEAQTVIREPRMVVENGGPRPAPGTLTQLFFRAVEQYDKPDALQVKMEAVTNQSRIARCWSACGTCRTPFASSAPTRATASQLFQRIVRNGRLLTLRASLPALRTFRFIRPCLRRRSRTYWRIPAQ